MAEKPTGNQKIDCRACLDGIGRIETSNSSVETKLSMLNSNMMKIVYALLGVIGANIGTKYIGTPILIYIAIYIAIVSAIFVLATTVTKRHCLSFWEKWIRYCFVAIVAYSSGLRIFHYQTNTPLTQTEGLGANVIYILLSVGFMVIAWKRDSLRQQNRRRWNDKVNDTPLRS